MKVDLGRVLTALPGMVWTTLRGYRGAGSDVTATIRAQRAEEELRRSEAFLAQAQRVTRTGSLWVNFSTWDIIWSDESYRLMEYPRTVKPTLELIMNRCHPDDRSLVQETVARSARDGTNIDFEHRLMMPDGAVKHIHIVLQKVDLDSDKPEFVGAVTDITEQKQSEERLRRSEAFLAEGQRLSLTGTFSWRLHTDEITWSEQLYHIFEFERGKRITLELIGSRVHPDDIPMLGDMIRRARNYGSDFEYEHRLQMPNGSVKYLHLVAHASRDEHGRPEYIGACQDITQRRLSEEALGKARSDLAHMARVTTLGALTASITHEVSQPLSGIITNANTCLRMLAANPPNVESARETVRRTLRDGNRASEVITRLRALFGRKPTTMEPVDLNEAAHEVITLSSSDLQRNRVIVRLEFAEDLPRVRGDRVQLQQVILNLIRNASDATAGLGDGPHLVVISTRRADGHRAHLSVRDTGHGFDPQAAERLFEAFYTTKGDGMGIGLAVSRSIIESHRGNLWAAPNDGPGATFSFSIPGMPEDADPAVNRKT